MNNFYHSINDAIFELEHQISNSLRAIEEQLKYTQKLKKHPYEYCKTVRSGILGTLLGKDKGQEVWSFEIKHKDKNTDGNFLTNTPTYKDLNLEYYKKLLFDKLKDTLEIAGFDNKIYASKYSIKLYPLHPIDFDSQELFFQVCLIFTLQ